LTLYDNDSKPAAVEKKTVEEELREAAGPSGPKPDGIDTDGGRCIYLDTTEFPNTQGVPADSEIIVHCWGRTRATTGGKLKIELRNVDVEFKNRADIELEKLSTNEGEENEEEDEEDDF
jgi:hypothetical protein